MSTTQKVIRVLGLALLIVGLVGVFVMVFTPPLTIDQAETGLAMTQYNLHNVWVAIAWGYVGIVGGAILVVQEKSRKMEASLTPALVFKLLNEDILKPNGGELIIEMNRKVMLPIPNSVSLPGQDALF